MLPSLLHPTCIAYKTKHASDECKILWTPLTQKRIGWFQLINCHKKAGYTCGVQELSHMTHKLDLLTLNCFRPSILNFIFCHFSTLTFFFFFFFFFFFLNLYESLLYKIQLSYKFFKDDFRIIFFFEKTRHIKVVFCKNDFHIIFFF